MPRAFPRDPEQAPARKLVAGLAKLGLAIRSQAWQEASRSGLTPTQGQMLGLLAASEGPQRLSHLAAELGVTAATASESLSALVDKGLASKRPDPDDRRAVAIALTRKGREEAAKAAEWPDFLLAGARALSSVEQEVFLRGVLKMIRDLQERGFIAPSRLCLTCVHFRPFAHPGDKAPHHCAFVDAPFGGGDLRLDCADHAPAPDAQADAAWRRFCSQGA